MPKAVSQEEIADQSAKDPEIIKVIQAIQTNKWPKDDKDLANYRKVRDELTFQGPILLRGQRLVIPRALWNRMVDIAHEAHQGIVKTKSLMRTKVWFPTMDKLITDKIANCIPCQSTSDLPPPPPVQMRELPKNPWEKLSVDFYGPINSEYLMVVIDDFSRYPIIDIVTSTSAAAVIPRLDQMFAAFGTPQVLRSDNGPPFNSKAFADFANYLGFRHHLVTPRWPRANGEAERFMKCIKKIVQTAQIEGRSWKQQLFNFLRVYRATPHTSTKICPHEALFGRAPRIGIPTFTTTPPCEPSHLQELRKNDAKSRTRMQSNADDRPYRITNLKVGDHVLVKNDATGKFVPTFNPSPATVVEIKGTRITVLRDGQRIVRNISFLKRITVPQLCPKPRPQTPSANKPQIPEVIPPIIVNMGNDDNNRVVPDDNNRVVHPDNVPQPNRKYPRTPSYVPNSRRYPDRDRKIPRHLQEYQT